MSQNLENVQVLGERLLIKTHDAEVIGSGAFEVSTDDMPPSKGTVVLAGPGRRLDNGDLIEMSVSVNDDVIFTEGAGHILTINDEEFRILEESEIFAIIRKTE